MAEQWLILKDYAETLGITEAAVRKAIKTGRIPETATRREKRAQGRPYVLINKRLADVAWYHNTTPTKGGKTSRNAQEKVAQTINSTSTPQEQQVVGVVTMNEASRREKVAKAALAELELAQLQNSLVSKEKVYGALFDAGKQLRDTIMAIPDRITADIAAAGGNRTQINKILTDALAGALETLADAYACKFDK